MAGNPIVLSEQQKRNWERLLEIYYAQPGRTLYSLQLSLRKLAIEILEAAPEAASIVVAGQHLMQFRDPEEKRAYIERHRRPGAFADDAMLGALLHALGFQPVIHIPISGQGRSFQYVPFQQETGDTLRIDIENNAYAYSHSGEDPDTYRHKTGSHWSLKDHHTPGIENSCGFFTVAQRIQEIGLVNIPVTLPEARVVSVEPTRIEAPVERPVVVSPDPAPVRNPIPVRNSTVIEIEEAFNKQEVKDQLRYEAAREKLKGLSVPQLIAIYHYGLTLAGSDSYLTGRPREADKELGGGDLIVNTIRTGNYPLEFESVVRDELVHMLAKEAWRNPKAYRELMKPATTCREEESAAAVAEPYRLPSIMSR